MRFSLKIINCLTSNILGGGPLHFSVSLSSLGTNQFLKKLIGTWFGQDLGVLGTKGMRLGLDNTLFTVDC